jgi:hypothetical protein
MFCSLNLLDRVSGSPARPPDHPVSNQEALYRVTQLKWSPIRYNSQYHTTHTPFKTRFLNHFRKLADTTDTLDFTQNKTKCFKKYGFFIYCFEIIFWSWSDFSTALMWCNETVLKTTWHLWKHKLYFMNKAHIISCWWIYLFSLEFYVYIIHTCNTFNFLILLLFSWHIIN